MRWATLRRASATASNSTASSLVSVMCWGLHKPLSVRQGGSDADTFVLRFAQGGRTPKRSTSG
jgi:hypothetical protein